MSTESGSPFRTRADFAYEAFCSAAIGGSIVALFYLLVDTLNGHALYTPSMIGGVLFAGVSPGTFSGIRLDWVALYSLCHFAVFGVLGFGTALLIHQVELHTRQPVLVVLALFAAFQLAFVVTAALLAPGLIAELGGASLVAIANLLAVGGMVSVPLTAHHPEGWWRLSHSAQ